MREQQVERNGVLLTNYVMEKKMLISEQIYKYLDEKGIMHALGKLK